jgi:hypothetical protein
MGEVVTTLMAHGGRRQYLKLAHIINDYKKVVDPNYFLYGFLPRMQLG